MYFVICILKRFKSVSLVGPVSAQCLVDYCKTNMVSVQKEYLDAKLNYLLRLLFLLHVDDLLDSDNMLISLETETVQSGVLEPKLRSVSQSLW